MRPVTGSDGPTALLIDRDFARMYVNTCLYKWIDLSNEMGVAYNSRNPFDNFLIAHRTKLRYEVIPSLQFNSCKLILYTRIVFSGRLSKSQWDQRKNTKCKEAKFVILGISQLALLRFRHRRELNCRKCQTIPTGVRNSGFPFYTTPRTRRPTWNGVVCRVATHLCVQHHRQCIANVLRPLHVSRTVPESCRRTLQWRELQSHS